MPGIPKEMTSYLEVRPEMLDSISTGWYKGSYLEREMQTD